jgi:hypothetical protein
MEDEQWHLLVVSIVKKEPSGIWKEEVTTYVQVLFRNLNGGTETT